MLNDDIISFIRTAVPIGVGTSLTFVFAWVSTKLGVTIDPSGATTALVPISITAVTAGYYKVVRVIEKKWPSFGWLLGYPAQPTYPAKAGGK